MSENESLASEHTYLCHYVSSTVTTVKWETLPLVKNGPEKKAHC